MFTKVLLEQYKNYVINNKNSLVLYNNIINYYEYSNRFYINLFNINNLNIINNYIYSLKASNKYSNGQINNIISSLKYFYKDFLYNSNLLNDLDYINVIFKDIKYQPRIRKIIEHLTKYDLDKAIKKLILIYKSNNAYKLKAILYFIYYSGIRAYEFYDSKRADFDLAHNQVKVKNRVLFYPERIKILLERYFNSEKELYNAFNIKELSYIFKALTKYSHKKINFITLRIAFANILMKKKMNFFAIRYLLDISSDELLNICKPSIEQIEREYKRRIK